MKNLIHHAMQQPVVITAEEREERASLIIRSRTASDWKEKVTENKIFLKYRKVVSSI